MPHGNGTAPAANAGASGQQSYQQPPPPPQHNYSQQQQPQGDIITRVLALQPGQPSLYTVQLAGGRAVQVSTIRILRARSFAAAFGSCHVYAAVCRMRIARRLALQHARAQRDSTLVRVFELGRDAFGDDVRAPMCTVSSRSKNL